MVSEQMVSEVVRLILDKHGEIAVQCPSGGTVSLDQEQAVRFLVGDVTEMWVDYYAKYYRVSQEKARVWLAWVMEENAQGYCCCRGYTKQGRPCRQQATGRPWRVDPVHFRPGFDDHCRYHSGPTSD